MSRAASRARSRRQVIATIAVWIVVLSGVIQIILGALFWSGRAQSLLAVHMMLGMLFVIALWTLGGLAARSAIAWRWFLLTVAWGVIVAGFGGMQAAILPGSLHWLVKIIHLLLGIIAMVMATMLGRAIRLRGA